MLDVVWYPRVGATETIAPRPAHMISSHSHALYRIEAGTAHSFAICRASVLR